MMILQAAGHVSTPCGFQNSSVLDAAHARLHNSPYLALRRLTCTLEADRLVLRGELPSFYMVQVAQSLVMGLPGIERVENRAQVGEPATLSAAAGDVQSQRLIASPTSRNLFASPTWDDALSLSVAGPSV